MWPATRGPNTSGSTGGTAKSRTSGRNGIRLRQVERLVKPAVPHQPSAVSKTAGTRADQAIPASCTGFAGSLRPCCTRSPKTMGGRM